MKTVYRTLILIVMTILGNMPLAQATTYTVTSLGDNGAGTLRQAITNANADVAAPHRIVFSVTGSIDITSGTLPNILRQTTIDGGTLGNVVINGNNSADFGLFFADATAANSVVKNLVINNYKIHGVVIVGAAGNITIDNCRIGTNALGTAAATLANSVHGMALTNTTGNTISNCVISGNRAMGIQISNSTNTTIKGNIIGLNAAGTASLPNLQSGIQMVNNSTSNFIGGGNIISGNAQHGISFVTGCNSNQIKGNIIGLNAAGNAAIGNGFSGIQFSSACTANFIGGTTKADRNILSGNGNCGIQLLSGCNYNIVQGNYIGTDSTGLAALGNQQNGVLFDVSAAYNQVGGTASGAGNVISGNLFSGVYLAANANFTLIQGNIIGLNKNGNAALPNIQNGISMASSSYNTVGGISMQERNIVSGNGTGNIGFGPNQFSGISASTYDANPARDNVIWGNYIGVGADGTTPIENSNHGIWIFRDNGSSSNISFSIRNNVISANAGNNSTIRNEQNRSLIYVYRSSLPSLIQGNTLLRARNAGMWLSSLSNVTVGGENVGEGNTILLGQNHGIQMEGSSDNVVWGNAIGIDITGTLSGGNSGAGINFTGTSERNQIGGLGTGQVNLIANNLTHGISMSVATARYNPIRGNSIFCNTGKGIQLSSLGNENIAVPKINSLSGTSTVFGTALPSAKVDLYYFATCNPCSGTSLQGKTYIATATADGAGNWSYQGGVSNLQITATQTNANNSTSEFSPREVLVLAGATTCGAVSDVTIQLTGATSGDAYQAYVGGTLVASTVSGNGNLGLTISTANLAIGNNPVTITSSVFGCGVFTTSTTNIRFNPVFSTVSASVNPICPGLNAAVTISGISSLGQYYLTTTGGIAISAASTGSGSVVLPIASAGFGVGNYPIGIYASITGCAPVLVGNTTLSVNTFSDAGSSLTSATICGGAISATLTLSGATIGDQYSLFINNLSQNSVTATDENLIFNIPSTQLTVGSNFISVYKSRVSCGTTLGISSSIVLNPSANNVTVTTGTSVCVGSNANVSIQGAQSGFSYYLTSTTGQVLSDIVSGNGTLSLIANSSSFSEGTYGFKVMASISGCTPTEVGSGTFSIVSPVDNSTWTSSTICGVVGSVSLVGSNASLGQSYMAYIGNVLVGSGMATASSINLGISTANLAFGNNAVLISKSLAGCGTVTVGSAIIRFTPSPSSGISILTKPVCLGSTAILTISGANLGYTYVLTTTTGVTLGNPITGSGTLFLTANTSSFPAGDYSLNVTSSISGCSPVASPATITISSPSNTSVQPMGPDTVCQFQTATFMTSVTGLFQWTVPSDAQLKALNSDSSLVRITFGNTSGSVFVKAYDVCANSFGPAGSKSVTLLAPPVAFSGGSFQNPGDLIKKYGTKTKEGEIVLTGIGSSQWTDGTPGPKYTYTWSASPETDITNKNSILASISPITFETKVYLTVSNGYCAATDSSLVELEIEQIPAAFSPNGDNVNDTWQIDHLYLYKNVKITVFNKWGSPVYESSGYPKSKEDMWNGKSNGEDLPVAVYYYIIDFGKERGRAPLNGSVTIVR